MDSYHLGIAELIRIIEKDGRIGNFLRMDSYGNFHFRLYPHETILTEKELIELAEDLR